MMKLGPILAAALLTPGVLAPAVASAAPPPTNERTSEVRLEHELDTVVAAGATGVTAEVDNGRHVTRASSGVAERGSMRPVPVNARFRVGSVSKAFLATVVLQLVAEHQLRLDDTVGDLLPGVLRHGSAITVRQLLDHTSGVPEVLTTFPRPGTPAFLDLRERDWTTRGLVDRVADEKLLFEPGSQASYSNTNYLLLGLVIERVTGQTYAAAVEQRILRPLHLNNTSLPGRDPILHGPHAHGYLDVHWQDGSSSLVDVTRWNPSLMNAAGDMISTTRDLNRFDRALLSGRLVPSYLLRQMTTPALDSIYGLGLIAHPLPCGGVAWGKDGDAPGFSTWTFSAPGDRIRVTVSVTWGAGDPDQAVNDLLDTELCR